MKTQSGLMQKGLMASLAASLFLSVGCAKKGDGFSAESVTPAEPAVVSPTTPRDTDGPRGAAFANGATAALTIDSLAALNTYVATHPVNNPTDVRISVKLKQVETNMYAGDIYISYYDNGQYYTGHFNASEGQNPTGNTATSGTLYPGAKHAHYNNWFNWGGKPVFHGFFQDQYGAIMLIIDESVDLGDGSGAVDVGGSIWFKNFANAQAQYNPQGIPCWYILTGPYDCRTLLVSGRNGDGDISSGSALYPTQSQFYTTKKRNPYIPEEPARGWRRLGTFSGLNKAKAFTQ